MQYEDKYISIEQALEMVKSGDVIVTGLGAAEAGLFMGQLHTIADRVRGVKVTNCLPTHPSQIYDPKYVDSFEVDGWFFAPQMRKAHANGNMAYIPNHLHLACTKRLQFVKPNIYVGAASMPDKHGYVSLSLSNTYEKRMLEAADLVILEVNPNMPYTLGDLQVPVSEVDYLVRADYAPPVIPDAPFSEKDAAIGKLIAEMVPDGSCIQLGIGGIPNAVAAALEQKNDLGVHTEMLTSGMMRLAKMGVINGKCKQTYRGKMVTTFAMGVPELYEFIDYNPAVAVMDGAWVNDPYVIAQNDNQVSINTSLEVDLTGQCASESLGSRQFSGTGGQSDTAVGAQMSKNGKSIIALYSTAMVKGPDGQKQEVSKIVPQLMPGAAVSLSRNDVDRVVTEYGVAELRGTSIRDRVARLIEIAHPKFREQLWDQAVEVGILGRR
ncbi:4-hydroxybutyrate--acetyl-CoA CoA transferase [Flavonifractor sp. An82]|uniref:acetyl-CoA hydrolase/transferase family protein n=1 Tax=Flavonifractor sp. An82 TaxID=1965660 RepID=UPI000B3AD57B|nr:acetyl-CoA hydrolase/transferase C-terminal domain-containing protein [Flavonifractor sp. An82]OUN19208.1 4-hydroxybutyrate--acetyl-CoA CoA transferase [Flavonifractor sp. An82]